MELVAELSWVRAQPKAAAAVLRERLKHFKGKEYFPPERGGVALVTKEGTAVVHEAIKYLEALEPMGVLRTGAGWAEGLELAAEDHVADIGSTGQVSHSSSDGTASYDRATRYGKFRSFGECLWYGSKASDARGIVLDLVIDDGVKSRGHRLGVCNPVYEVVGVAHGPHHTFGSMAAMEFAAGWQPDQAAVAARRSSGPAEVKDQQEARRKVDTQWKSLGGCALCGEPIRGGSVMEVDKIGGKLHAACFKCESCETSLRGTPFMVHERRPFCKACYGKKHGERCTACGEPITGGMMKCSLGQFHVECIVCARCDAVIGKGKFSTTGGAIECSSCAGGAPGAPVRRARGGGARGAAAAEMPAKLGITAPANPLRAGAGAAPKAKAKAKVGGPAAGAAPPRKGAAPGTVGKAKGGAMPKRSPVSLAAAGSTVLGVGGDYAALG